MDTCALGLDNEATQTESSTLDDEDDDDEDDDGDDDDEDDDVKQVRGTAHPTSGASAASTESMAALTRKASTWLPLQASPTKLLRREWGGPASNGYRLNRGFQLRFCCR